jgi:uncharacterized protein YciI
MGRFLWTLAAAALLSGSAAAQAPAPPGGSQTYYVVFLRPNPARKPIEQAERERIMTAHMANIHKMADDGVLAAAGPMEDKAVTISGIFVLKAGSLADAQAIAARDPTVAEGRNTVDIHAWRGPEGIGTGYFRWKKENPAADDVMAVHAFCILGKAGTKPGDPHASQDHAAYIESLHAAGSLAAAGTVEGDPDMAGIVIFKSDSIEDAKGIIARDPAVASGQLVPEFHRWWTADRVLPW